MKTRAWWLLFIPLAMIFLANKIGSTGQKVDEFGDPITSETAAPK